MISSDHVAELLSGLLRVSYPSRVWFSGHFSTLARWAMWVLGHVGHEMLQRFGLGLEVTPGIGSRRLILILVLICLLLFFSRSRGRDLAVLGCRGRHVGRTALAGIHVLLLFTLLFPGVWEVGNHVVHDKVVTFACFGHKVGRLIGGPVKRVAIFHAPFPN